MPLGAIRGENMKTKTLTAVVEKINSMPLEEAKKAWLKLSVFERMIMAEFYKGDK